MLVRYRNPFHRLDWHRSMSEAPKTMQVRERLVRKLKRRCWHAYAGYNVNMPRKGWAQVVIYTAAGLRWINIDPIGRISWSPSS